ncbi:MAG: hypothetical protein WC791_02095 [Candidatus Paceibacterota bacterium]|jgi:hypothetical protein
MKEILMCFVFGALCFFGAGDTASQSVGLCPASQILQPLAVVAFFVFGTLSFAGAFDRLVEWQEARGFSYPASSSATEGWEASLIIVIVLVPGALFTWAGAIDKGREVALFWSCVTLLISFYLFLRRFKSSPA